MLGRIFAVAFCIGLLAAPAKSFAGQPSHPDGFWKVPPARALNAEFGGEDPMGLSARRHIPTDCSIAWKDRSHDKIYCFSSPMSSMMFQDELLSMLPKAEAFWKTEGARTHGLVGKTPPK